MRAVGLLIVVLSLVVCTTARRLWTVTHGTEYANSLWDEDEDDEEVGVSCSTMRRQHINYCTSSCDKRSPRSSRFGGRESCYAMCYREGGRICRRRLRTRMDKVAYEEHVSGHCVKWDRYHRCLVKITENGEYVPTRVGEVMERRRLRARANFEEAVERRRLPSCYHSFYVCPRYDSEKECKCKCKKQYQRCYSRATGRDCTTAGSPKRVCNGQRCIWDWGGWTPRGGNNLMDAIENCGNKKEICEKRCPRSSSKKKMRSRWGSGHLRI